MLNLKQNIEKYSLYATLTAFAGFVVLAGYGKIWEHRQPNQIIENARVLSIEPYSYYNDLHLNSRGYEIRIEGENRVINFSVKNWDDTVNEGDSVDLVVRRNFPLFEDKLNGIGIDDHK